MTDKGKGKVPDKKEEDDLYEYRPYIRKERFEVLYLPDELFLPTDSTEHKQANGEICYFLDEWEWNIIESVGQQPPFRTQLWHITFGGEGRVNNERRSILRHGYTADHGIARMCEEVLLGYAVEKLPSTYQLPPKTKEGDTVPDTFMQCYAPEDDAFVCQHTTQSCDYDAALLEAVLQEYFDMMEWRIVNAAKYDWLGETPYEFYAPDAMVEANRAKGPWWYTFRPRPIFDNENMEYMKKKIMTFNELRNRDEGVKIRWAKIEKVWWERSRRMRPPIISAPMPPDRDH